MLPEFDLVLPHSLRQALEILQEEPLHAYPLAGGTNLIVDMRSGRCSPAVLVNINDLPELHEIKLAGDELKIGSAVTISELQKNPIVRKNFPILIEAANVFANPLVRNRATLGGNLADASPAADCAPPSWHSLLRWNWSAWQVTDASGLRISSLEHEKRSSDRMKSWLRSMFQPITQNQSQPIIRLVCVKLMLFRWLVQQL